MTDNFEQILRALRSVVLSEHDKKNMRISLQSHMRAYPMRTRSTFWRRVGNSFDSILNSQTLATHPAFAACVLVLVIGVGTSYAAQSALPGEPLYAFKTRVNESVQGAMQLSPQAKTEWNAELTFRRLQEAEELAVTGDLNTVATADIESGLDSAMQHFDSSVTLLQTKDNAGANNAQNDLEASLNAHEVVLSSIPTKTKGETTHIASLVQKHATQLNKKRSASQATLTATDSPAVKTAALQRKKSAEDAIGQVQLLSTVGVDTQVASSVSSIAVEAQNDVKIGDSEGEQGRWGKAYGAFQDAVRKVKETSDGVTARSWLQARFGVGLDVIATTTATTSFDIQNEDN